MAKHFNHSISLGSALGDFFKDIGKALARGFGLIIGVGLAAALFGGVGGGVAAAIYGGPVIGFGIAGAVAAIVLVYGIWLLAMSDY